ncbi:CoA ester lyase [Bordetella sp. LUAb4]|uniref:HpcH/HpaI aldolase/citrate lyase family protein n=1 Tax=Bordetella sp. LUAb4 TaxID=2843195 RepID=UPI001E34DEA4|nr:CoA ester lyase [Bordetella sp. LUAb4]
MAHAELPFWRSLLFCPANAPRFVAKAHERGADAIILDLEDAVALAEKAGARAGVARAAAQAGSNGADVLVRINRELDLAVADIHAAVGKAVNGLVVPKVLGPEHLQLIAEVIDAREAELGLPRGHTRLVALVESAAGVTRLDAIARAHPRLVGMAVGGEDLATDLDAEPSADTLYVAKMLGVHAARAAGILPLGVLASVAGTHDDDAYRQMVLRSRRLGFAGATCVHPRQVAVLNDAFSPGAAQVERARGVVAAYEAAVARGAGAVAYEGNMIDRPVALRAMRLLERAATVHTNQEG